MMLNLNGACPCAPPAVIWQCCVCRASSSLSGPIGPVHTACGKDVDLDLFDEKDNILTKLAKKYRVCVQTLTFRLENLGYITL